jgi:predicted lipid-binding transport protein (Tim44 family)
MGNTIKRTAAARLRGIRKSRTQELRWSIYGIVGGVLIGMFIGGIGVAILGRAFGIPSFAILAVLGALIGNRVGVEMDRAAWGK